MGIYICCMTLATPPALSPLLHWHTTAVKFCLSLRNLFVHFCNILIHGVRGLRYQQLMQADV